MMAVMLAGCYGPILKVCTLSSVVSEMYATKRGGKEYRSSLENTKDGGLAFSGLLCRLTCVI